MTPFPEQFIKNWTDWCSGLHLLTEYINQRRFTLNDTDIVDVQLHGFADASSAAYGGVV